MGELCPLQLYRHGNEYSHSFVTGSIVRVKCIDFMTYEAVEFNLGPKVRRDSLCFTVTTLTKAQLNMVVGPNGSGKSSIVCAIAIGLGFSPKVHSPSHLLNGIARLSKHRSSKEQATSPSSSAEVRHRAPLKSN